MNKKLISVALTAATFVSLVGVTPAFAQSSSDLQAQIAALLAQIQSLQGQLGTGGAPSSYSFTRDLTVGSSGTDVKALQQFLNGHGAVVSGSGVGSPGNESSYFGGLTKAALAQWQGSNGVTPALGYFGPKTRAFIASMGGTVTPPTTYPAGCTSSSGYSSTTGLPCSGAGVPVVVPSSGLSVSLASNNPAAGSLIAGAGRVPVLSFNLTAGTSGAVNVNGLKFKKVGVISDSNLSGAYLVQNGKVVAQYVSLGSGVITFSNLGLSIPAGQTVGYTLALDISSGVTAGNTVGFSLLSATDVSATDAANTAITAGGAFPLNGSMMTASTVTNPSLATLAITSSTVGNSTYAGTQGVLVSAWTAAVGNNTVNLGSIKFRVIGSAAKSDLQNVKLYVNGSQVGSTLSSVAVNGDAYFDLSANPASLKTGNSTLQVYADVMGSPSFTFAFELLNTYDVYAVDSQYNTSLTSTIAGGTGTTVTINQGQLTVSLASDSPTGNVAKGMSSVTLAKFKIYAAGEAVKVKFLDFTLSFATGTASGGTAAAALTEVGTFVRNVSLIDDQGGQVGTTISNPASATQTCDKGVAGATAAAPIVYSDCFGTPTSPINYIIPANTTRVFSLKGDVQTTIIATAITAALKGQSTANLQGLTSSQTNTSSAGAITASALSVAANSLTATKNAAVGNPTVAAGSQAQRVGSYLLTASSAEGVNVSNVSLTVSASAASTFQNLMLKVGSTQFGNTQPTITASGAYTFSGTPIAVPAGQSVTVDVYSDIITGAVAASTTLSGCTGSGAISYSSVSCSSILGQAVAIGGAPTLTVSLDSSSPSAGQLVSGTSQATLAAIRIAETSGNEDVKIKTLNIFQGISTSTTKSTFSNVTLYQNGVAIPNAGVAAASANNDNGAGNATTTFGSGYGNVYTFNFTTPITVTKSGTVTLTLKGDVPTWASPDGTSLTDNSTSTFGVATTTDAANITNALAVVAQGATSQTAAAITLSSVKANEMVLLRSNVTITVAALGATSNRAKSAVDDLATITFTAPNVPNSQGIALGTTSLTISGTLATGTWSNTNISLVDSSNVAYGTVASTTGCPAGGGTCVFRWTGFGARGVLSPGGSLTMKLRIISSSSSTIATTGTSVSFYATIQAATDVLYNTAGDNTGNTVGLPASVVPLPVASVSYVAGQ